MRADFQRDTLKMSRRSVSKLELGNSVDLPANLKKFLDDRNPNARYASFDYCFNYFQSFRESGTVAELASPTKIQMSCLQLGFYLASWGMFRGSTDLLQRSARHLIPVIEVVAQTEMSLWEIDADRYTESNIRRLCEQAHTISQALPDMSNTLVTKIMLGVFGSVPAFDTYFRKACKPAGIVATFGCKALRGLGRFYRDNAAVIDANRVLTLDFASGENTQRRYTRAKVIDMAFFIDGEERDEAKKAVRSEGGL